MELGPSKLVVVSLEILSGTCDAIAISGVFRLAVERRGWSVLDCMCRARLILGLR
jgi:hypothetical protein